MSTSAAIFATALDAVDAAAAGLPVSILQVKALDDSFLLAVQRRVAESRRVLDACASLVAGEVSFRSRRDLGYAGLAQREGFQSAEKLVQNTTGSTAREATTLVTVGTMVHEAMVEEAVDPATGEVPEGLTVKEPWLAAVGAAVSAGTLTVEAARAIKSGLGEPMVDEDGAGITAEDLAGVVARLLEESSQLDADRLFRLARQLRDELDLDGIAVRERLIYEQRAFRRTKRANGLPRFTLDPDLETAALLDDLYDKLLSPRRGGPRFVDPEGQAWAQSVLDDPRSNDQYLHDAITGLLRLGVDADQSDRDYYHRKKDHENTDDKTSTTGDTATNPRRSRRSRRPRIVGSRTPAVRVLVTEKALATGTGAGRLGAGRLEGSDIPISLDTVKRIACEGGILPIRVSDTDDVVALGREERLFTGRQKIALAVRDGGCLWPNCDKPPNWTEAHHITPWASGGNTDLCDGVLLCKFHHMLLHNNHWNISRTGSQYWLIPPPDIDPRQEPIPLHSKSAALHDLQRERQQAGHAEKQREKQREKQSA